MDAGQINPILLIASLMVASTPILLAAIGEMVVEKAGVLNLGVEGMMITGAVVGFAFGVTFSSPALGFLMAALAGALLSALFAFITLLLKSNQVATGLALTLFGLGLSSLIGKPYEGMRAPTLPAFDIPLLSDIPVLGPILFQHDPLVYLSVLIVAAVWFTLSHSRAGLILRAVGENHDAAHALGYKVIRVRFAAILFGGAMAGLGGAYVSLVRVVLLGAYLFGGVSVLQLNLQAAGVAIPVEYLSMSPYLVTIAVLVVISMRGNHGAPGALGRAFHASS